MLRFLFGGVVTAIVGVISKEFGPVIAGLFLAFPAIFPASATLIEKHEKERREEAGGTGTMLARNAAGADATGAALGAIGLFTFAVVVWRFLATHNPRYVIAVATVAWLAVSIAAWKIRKRIG